MEETKREHLHSGHRNRVKEQFAKSGMRDFQDHQVLEMLLFYAIPQRDTNDLAHMLIDEFGSLAGVFDAPLESLEAVKGMGKNSATLIKMVPEIYSKYLDSKNINRKLVLSDPESVTKYFASKFIGYQHEVMMAAFVDNQCRHKKTIIVSEGGQSSTDVNIRKIAATAMNLNATSVIIAHNYPQGVAAPSGADIEAVRVIKKIFKPLDLTLLDSLIISDDSAYSMANHNKFAYLFDY